MDNHLPADFARQGMLLEIVFCLSDFFSLFGTFPERCKYFFFEL